MALTGPEKAMYNFLIKREAAGSGGVAAFIKAEHAGQSVAAGSAKPVRGRRSKAKAAPGAQRRAQRNYSPNSACT